MYISDVEAGFCNPLSKKSKYYMHVGKGKRPMRWKSTNLDEMFDEHTFIGSRGRDR
jgi:hypothetical protein